MEDRLRKFACVVDAGGFTKAASELHISQPALSTAIAKLERELKTPLFVRGARPISVTSAGELAYAAAKNIVMQTDNLKVQLAELAKRPLTLKIGMIDSVAEALFERGSGLAGLAGTKLSVVVNNSRYLAEAVERGDLDLAFIAEQPQRQPLSLEALPLATEPLVVVARAFEAPAGTALQNFLSYDQASYTFRLVQRALRAYGVSVKTSFYSTSPEVMLRLTRQGQGVAALPYLMVRPLLQTGELVRLGQPKPWLIERRIVLLTRRDKQLPQALHTVAHSVADALNALLTEAS